MGKHTANLRRIFPGIGKMRNATLEAGLRTLERRGHVLALDTCNRQEKFDGEYAKRESSILNDLDLILDFRKAKVSVFLNTDPRGYALKIEDEWLRKSGLNIHTDVGGYGIICPSGRWK